MIKYVVGNLLSITAGIIVHGCNAQGVMGAGVAAAIKEKYPNCFGKYFRSFNHDSLDPVPGDVVWWDDKNKLVIANAITQEGFSNERDTDYNAIDLAFNTIFERAATLYVDRIHIPLIGAGIGGGSWAVIEQIILDRAANCNYKPGTVDVLVHCLTEDDIPRWRR